MLEKMPWVQFLAWMAYSELEPFGEERSDLRAGMTTAAVYNVHRDPKLRPLGAEDFMPFAARRGRSAGGARRPLTDPKAWAATKREVAVAFAPAAEQPTARRRRARKPKPVERIA